jgi:hypothetical protein
MAFKPSFVALVPISATAAQWSDRINMNGGTTIAMLNCSEKSEFNYGEIWAIKAKRRSVSGVAAP